jgi:hypothetical protein
MSKRSSNRVWSLIGAATLLAAIAVAVPAISSADRGHGDGHHDRTVGTIASFDADTGTLVITPTNGDDVTGMVNDRTKIKCEDEHGDDHGDDGPNHDQGDDHGDDGPNHDQGDDNGDDGHGGPGPGKRGHGSGRRGNCGPDDLTVGATVEEAELEITADGLVFEEVELR